MYSSRHYQRDLAKAKKSVGKQWGLFGKSFGALHRPGEMFGHCFIALITTLVFFPIRFALYRVRLHFNF